MIIFWLGALACYLFIGGIIFFAEMENCPVVDDETFFYAVTAPYTLITIILIVMKKSLDKQFKA